MTDEEKEAIEVLKMDKEDIEDSIYSDFGKEYAEEFKKFFSLALNLIEKQQKEIEELKDECCCATSCERKDKETLFLKQKIKDKIEELKVKSIKDDYNSCFDKIQIQTLQELI